MLVVLLMGPECMHCLGTLCKGCCCCLHQLLCFDTRCGLIFGAGATQPAAEVSYVERIRAMSALFNVGEMATSEVSQAALQAALNSVRDGSIFAANHYADALDIYV